MCAFSSFLLPVQPSLCLAWKKACLLQEPCRWDRRAGLALCSTVARCDSPNLDLPVNVAYTPCLCTSVSGWTWFRSAATRFDTVIGGLNTPMLVQENNRTRDSRAKRSTVGYCSRSRPVILTHSALPLEAGQYTSTSSSWTFERLIYFTISLNVDRTIARTLVFYSIKGAF